MGLVEQPSIAGDSTCPVAGDLGYLADRSLDAHVRTGRMTVGATVLCGQEYFVKGIALTGIKG